LTRVSAVSLGEPYEPCGYHNAVHRLGSLLLALALAAAPGARAQPLPDLGESPQTEPPPRQERRIGDSIMREIRRDPDYVGDPEVADYVQQVGFRLVAASPESRRHFEFFVVRGRPGDGFRSPGGL